MSLAYKAPLRDMTFLYFELLQGVQINQLAPFKEADQDTVQAILEEAAKLIESEIAPLNPIGDQQGCQLNDGEVTTPDGFKKAYQLLVEGGWTGLTEPVEFGGMGLPYSVGFMVSEMLSSANQSFSMYPGLTHSAAQLIEAYGTEQQKARYLPKFAEGSWSGTMCLTEAHCGTDLGLLQTKAIPQDGGSYQLTGTKIFISSGEHDLTENIIHLVLARLPDAPEGIKGISLFIVPKFLTDEQGTIVNRNGIQCGALEHKMGIHGNSTCVMNLDQAEGYLIGEPNQGMRAMFVMMNAARLGTGLQGFAAGERAYQGAVQYARERIQMRSVTGPSRPDLKADPIIVHPDVRRMLLTMRAYTEGCRAMSYWIAQELDIAAHHPDAQRRQQADDLAALLTPVIKAFGTDTGYEATNLGVQIFGGHGYIHEHGMEQLVRDTRIAQLYEGTNGIQALDLVGRKLPMHDGRLLKTCFNLVDDFITQHQDHPLGEKFIQPLAHGMTLLKQATEWLQAAGRDNPNHPMAAACDYLRLFGLVMLAYQWANMALYVAQHDADKLDDFYQSKLTTASFFMAKLLPQTEGLMAIITSGSDSLMNVPESHF